MREKDLLFFAASENLAQKQRGAAEPQTKARFSVLCASQALTWSTRSASVTFVLRLFLAAKGTEALPKSGKIFAAREEDKVLPLQLGRQGKRDGEVISTGCGTAGQVSLGDLDSFLLHLFQVQAACARIQPIQLLL